MNLKLQSAITGAFILWSPLLCLPVSAETPASMNTPQSADNDSAEKRQAAIDAAKSQLGKLPGMDAMSLKIISTEAYTWPDSSLGCGKPGKMAAQVITSGYVITLQSNNGIYIVHATDKYAVICERNAKLRNLHEVNAPLRNLDDVIARARSDLSDKLHVQPELIRTLTFIATQWPDTSMGCVVEGEAVEQKPVKGYRIALNYQGRTFVYHTDMNRVRACPPIEAN